MENNTYYNTLNRLSTREVWYKLKFNWSSINLSIYPGAYMPLLNVESWYKKPYLEAMKDFEFQLSRLPCVQTLNLRSTQHIMNVQSNVEDKKGEFHASRSTCWHNIRLLKPMQNLFIYSFYLNYLWKTEAKLTISIQ